MIVRRAPLTRPPKMSKPVVATFRPLVTFKKAQVHTDGTRRGQSWKEDRR
jgi:hypothetical protein